MGKKDKGDRGELLMLRFNLAKVLTQLTSWQMEILREE